MPGVMTVDEVQALLPVMETWRLKIDSRVLALGVSNLALHLKSLYVHYSDKILLGPH